MCKILIFGGTAEGRRLAEFCAENKINAYVSVVTEYGAKLLENADQLYEHLHILTGRLNCSQITDFIMKHNVELVIDSTHPYAVEATENIKDACCNTDVKYLRVVREKENNSEYGKYFQNIDSVVDFLNDTNERIFITTGSKELERFCKINNYKERCIVRIIPDENNLNKCISLGFNKECIIAKKGPFSEEENIAQIKKHEIKYLVTKDSGNIGGFMNKITAAKKCGAELLIIDRPNETGNSLSQAENILLMEKINE